MIADEKVGQKGVKVKCKKCGNIIVVKPHTESTDQPAAASEAPGIGSGAPAPAQPTASAPPQDSQMGGAFDSLFGGGASATAPSPAFDGAAGGLGLAALAGAAAPAAAAAKKAGEKEWYVAIDDSQVGPIDIGEIEQRWDGNEIEEDSLAWKAGMSDWMPIAEIPELAYLVTQKPHQNAQARSTGRPGGTSASAGAAAAAFGAAAAASEEISWKPSAASALSSLVQEEIQAAATPKEAPPEARPAGVPDLGFGSSDLFGAGGNGASAARGPDPFAAPAPTWSVPTAPRRSGGSKVLYVILGVVGLAIVGLLGFVALKLTKQSGSPPLAQAPQQPAATPGAVQPGPQPSSKPAPAPQEARTERPRPSPEPARDKPKPRDDGPPPAKTKSRGGGDDIDELLEDTPKGPPAKAALSKQDIFNGIKKNGPMVADCIKSARSKSEIVPGEYKFILDWTIKPDGSVTQGKLKGPANVMGTSLPACFASVMRRWSFPPSQRETPVANFPFGPINIR